MLVEKQTNHNFEHHKHQNLYHYDCTRCMEIMELQDFKVIIIDIRPMPLIPALAPAILKMEKDKILERFGWIAPFPHKILCKKLIQTTGNIRRDGKEFIRYIGVKED